MHFDTMAQEDIHSLIQCNLQQLHLLHPIPFTFKEGMFKVLNIKGFQDCIHYLLNIVEPVKCSKMIPWPLLDKKGESQFRIAVKTLLMEINAVYPEANLPKIFPSFLMNPGGEKFAHFMWKLTKFVLFRSLCQAYGMSDVLLPPRTFSNDSLANAKLSLVQAVTESTTQKAIANQLKIDSLLSQECERQCSIQLSELEEEAKTYENLLKEAIKDLPASTEMKEKLCYNISDSDVIAEWVADVEAEGRVIEAIIHVLNNAGINVTNFLETIKLAENNDAFQLCLDPSCLNIPTAYRDSMDDDLKELMSKTQDGKLSLSEFIHSLLGLQASLIHHIEGKGLQNMSTLLAELHSVSSGFHEYEILFSDVETNLRNTLKQVQNNYEALCKGFKTWKPKPTEAEVSSSIISSVHSGTSAEDVYITDRTPVRGFNRNICNRETGPEVTANIKLDLQLLQTPEFDRALKSPLCMTKISSTRKECETPVGNSICTVPATTSKKLRATSLCSLTSSLVKKKKKTVEMAQQFQSVQSLYMGHRARAVPTISKELFEESTEETQEKFSHIPASLCENKSSSTHCPVDDCFDDTNEDDHHLFPVSVSEDNVTSSPASLLCSPTPTETEQHSNKKGNRRKSLDSIIQRYLKIRQNMNLS